MNYHSVSERENRIARVSTAILVALGVALRLREYVANFSLNHDDICLALNVINRGMGGLMRTLDFDQAAPLGFLWMERLAVLAFGDGQRALRFWPLVAGCLSVVMFWRLAERLLPPSATAIVVGFFAMSQALIGASVQVKPYSLDVLVAVAIAWLCLPMIRGDADQSAPGIVAAAGAAVMWFSFPAIFVLGGMGVVIALQAIERRGGWSIRRAAPIFLAWAVSAALAFWFSMRPGLLNHRLAHVDADYEFPIHSLRLALPWLRDAICNLGSLSTSVRLAPAAGIVILFALLAAIVRRDRIGMLLAAPLLLTLLAGVFQRYPWLPRLIFFLAPLMLLLAARE